ncbi:transport and Golgi organization protein 11 [Patella vulgata]|uniref:transport and Golgi organization protein 11 n=1 Tax=Patella vulgata TaxID=6465 RepID=UPI00217F22FA|nr:transport and Golgi organization protein 11 [Patella vulgata]
MTEVNGVNDTEETKSHVKSLPSDYSDVQSRSYDPEYISDISNKMQVPDRISMGEPNDLPYIPKQNGRMSDMHVPDRIILAGEDKHIGLKEGLRELELNKVPSADTYAYVGLLTPPRTLTLEERFPVVEDNVEKHNQLQIQKNDSNNSHFYNSTAPLPYTPGYSPNDSILVNEEDEATVLRTHVAKLSRRIAVMEQDNQRRSQREVFLYPMVMGYFVLRFFFWFFKSK